LLDCQASKKSQFDDLALAGIQLRKALQRLVQLDELLGLLGTENKAFIQRHAFFTGPSFLPEMAASVVD
jgi:hypothetical protein